MSVIKQIERNKDGLTVIDQLIVDESVLNATNIYVNGNILQGSSSNDIHKVNSELDMVLENANSGDDTVSSLVSFELSDNIENLTLENVIKKETINGIKCLVYGNPEDERWYLDSYQDDDGVAKLYNVKNINETISTYDEYDFIQGDCAVVCIENILIQAGKIINSERNYSSNLVEFSALSPRDLRQTVLLKDLIENDFCVVDSENESSLGGIYNGILTQPNISSVLNYYGM